MLSVRVLALVALTSVCSGLCDAQEASAERGDFAVSLDSAMQSGEPVLLFLEIEEHRDPELAAGLSEAVAALKSSPQLARLAYPAEPYAKVAAAKEFVRWADAAGVSRLPAVVWVGPDGRPYGMEEMSETDPASVVSRQVELLNQQFAAASTAFTGAAALDGVEKASRLHDALQQISEPCRLSYLDVMQQIVDLDPENEAALRELYEPVLVEIQIDTAIQEQVYPLIDSASYAEAREVLKGLVEQTAVSSDQKQLLLAFQAELLHSEGQTELAVTTLDQAISIAPQSATASRLEEVRRRLIDP